MASIWKGTLSFANLGEVKKLYGYANVHAFSDLQGQNIKMADYTNATNGLYLTDFTGVLYSQGEYRDAFGYDAFPVTPEQFNTFIAAESKKYGEVVAKTKATLD